MSKSPAPESRVPAVIEKLDLKLHPEGGWYREIHRSSAQVQTTRGVRAAITAIYYLLERNQISRWHVVKSDEIWHFYQGAPLELLAYDPQAGRLRRCVLGTADDHEHNAVMRAGVWQAARSLGEFSLAGCTVGPGFDFEDFKFVADLPAHRTHFADRLEPFASLL